MRYNVVTFLRPAMCIMSADYRIIIFVTGKGYEK